MYLCVGIGINVLQQPADFPAEVRDAATSVRIASGKAIDRGAFVAAIYNTLDRRYTEFTSGDRCSFLEQVRRRMPMLGGRISVHAGADAWPGTAIEVADDGALLVADDRGAVHRIIADDVSVRSDTKETDVNNT